MVARAVAAARVLQLAIFGLLLVGVYLRSIGTVVNAVLALTVTFLPALLSRDRNVDLGGRMVAYLTLALFLHTLGMLGPYGNVPWWDHVTHTLSATVVAAVGYAVTRAFDEHSASVEFPEKFLVVFVVLFTFALGVLWEVVEFAARLASEAVGMDAVLVQYGLADTLTDLVFDAVGAIVVALLGHRRLRSAVEHVKQLFSWDEA